MAQERQVSPLPVGRYWLTVEKSLFQEWFDWLKDMGRSVKVTETEESPDHLFTIFQVTNNAAFFPSERFGFPDKAPSNIKSEQDAIQAPDVETPDLGTLLQGLITVGKWTAIGLVGLAAVKLIKKD